MINLKQVLIFTIHFFQAKKKNTFPVTLKVLPTQKNTMRNKYCKQSTLMLGTIVVSSALPFYLFFKFIDSHLGGCSYNHKWKALSFSVLTHYRVQMPIVKLNNTYTYLSEKKISQKLFKLSNIGSLIFFFLSQGQLSNISWTHLFPKRTDERASHLILSHHLGATLQIFALSFAYCHIRMWTHASLGRNPGKAME